MWNSTQVLHSHVFARVPLEKMMHIGDKHVCPHVKGSFEMNDLHNMCHIQFTFHSNISYVALRPYSKKGPVMFPQMYTHVKGPTPHITRKYTHTAAAPPTPQPWLHQDDSRPLSPRDKDSLSWDDVTAAFLMGVNLCLAEQQQKNLCVALDPHVLPRMRSASAPFCSSMWLSFLTFSPISLSFSFFQAPLFFFSSSF